MNYCIPTCHGSSALVVALEALGVQYGSEVLVPGLTWVACASAVASIGAIPVLIDVDSDTLCMSLSAAKKAITPNTSAIMIVHLYSSVADIDGFLELSLQTGIPLLEDCSQAHGAKWKGKRVGSFGDAAAFSFQQTKLLTSGEGGAVLTNSAENYYLLQQIRADGRAKVKQPIKGYLDIEEVGDVQGRNYGMSEFHAALLIEGLKRLDEENEKRNEFVHSLKTKLNRIDGVKIQGQPSELSFPVYYHLCLRFDLNFFGNSTIDKIAKALSAELRLPAVEPVDVPLNKNKLYCPLRSPRVPSTHRELLNPERFELPVADEARRTCLTIPHNALLASPDESEVIIKAIEKIRYNFLLRTESGTESA